MIDSERVKDLVIDFNVSLIKAKGAETIEEAVKRLRAAREFIGEIEKIVLEMMQEEFDLTQNIHNRHETSISK